MSNNIAPTCPISHSQPTQPTPSVRVTMPVIPKVSDLLTALQALRALNVALNNITKGNPHVNNVYRPDQVDARTAFPGYARGTWTETRRTYKIVPLVNPDNPAQSVGIKQIASVDFLESVTGNTLSYTSK